MAKNIDNFFKIEFGFTSETIKAELPYMEQIEQMAPKDSKCTKKVIYMKPHEGTYDVVETEEESELHRETKDVILAKYTLKKDSNSLSFGLISF